MSSEGATSLETIFHSNNPEPNGAGGISVEFKVMGEVVTKDSREKERPFHLVRKAFYMVISLEYSLFKQIW